MGEVERYPHGTFCWVDLGTPDVAGAKTFYGGLLGWDLEDSPGPDDTTYTMARLNGYAVAGIHAHSEDEGTGWSSSISVDDADAATTRAAEFGATVELEPFEIPETARMSVIRDPAGAQVTLWQPKGFIGAAYVNDHGSWGWNELVAEDLDAAVEFYGAMFGWTSEDAPGGIRRMGFSMGDLLIGGAHAPIPVEDPTPRWTIAFAVADAARAAARVSELGGTIVLPPMEIPMGKFTVAADQAGATFTLSAAPAGPLRGVDGS